MKQEHYPSLELCKRLTETGFPKTHIRYFENQIIGIERVIMWDYLLTNTDYLAYVCPSIAELLDEMNWITCNIPSDYNILTDLFNDDVWIYKKTDFCNCGSYCWDWEKVTPVYTSLPNALAEMWLWLKENNYLK